MRAIEEKGKYNTKERVIEKNSNLELSVWFINSYSWEWIVWLNHRRDKIWKGSQSGYWNNATANKTRSLSGQKWHRFILPCTVGFLWPVAFQSCHVLKNVGPLSKLQIGPKDEVGTALEKKLLIYKRAEVKLRQLYLYSIKNIMQLNNRQTEKNNTAANFKINFTEMKT